MMGDYVEQTLEFIKRLEAQLNSESATILDEYTEELYQSRLFLPRLFLPQLVETRRTLEHESFKPTTLEGHRAVHRELHLAMMQIETSVKEWCNPRHHNDERALGKRREHCRETLLAVRWWTMVTALQAGQRSYFQTVPFEVARLPAGGKYSSHGDVPSMERKGESQVTSQSRAISSYERQLPSIGFETWLEGSDQILQWKVEFGNILGKDESNANMTLEAIRGADYRVVVIEDIPGIYVDEAKSPLIKEEVTLDLTRDVLGVSQIGAWVIRTKCQGVDCALKRVADGDSEPVLARLSHPHIVQLIHFWRKDEYMFLVMELMEGDLTDLLSRHKRANDTLLSVSVAVDIMLQTAKGMLYLHDLGIAHPHLCCSNVLFRESDVSQEGGMQYIVKLGGFRNCAWDASDGKRQDVYRFGLFCLEVLTGRQQCEDPLEMVPDTRPSIPETIPQVLRFCISSCFESNVQLGFAQVVTLLLLAQVQVLKSQENEVFLSFGTCEDLDLVQLNQQYSESPSASGADLEKYPIHQLYPEPDVAGSDFNPSATLIFFHGFAKSSDEWKSTWMTRNREHVWPKEWLPKDLPGNVRILSLSYDIDAPGESQDIGAIEIGRNALRQLVLSSKWKLTDPKAKVILIGHSFGGLVIKSLVVEAHNLAFIPGKAKTEEPLVMKCPNFLENLEGIVFYSVPGSASQDQQFEEYIVKLNQTGVLQRSSLMQALLKDTRLFNQQMISLCSQFEEIVPEKTQILGFTEGKGMRRIREKQVVVSDASARAQMKKAEFNIVEEDNHFEVCRPVSGHHKGYEMLVGFLRDKLKIGSLNFGVKKGSMFNLDAFVQSENVPTANQQDVPTSNPEDVPKSNPLGVPTGNQRLQPGFRFHPSDMDEPVVMADPLFTPALDGFAVSSFFSEVINATKSSYGRNKKYQLLLESVNKLQPHIDAACPYSADLEKAQSDALAEIKGILDNVRSFAERGAVESKSEERNRVMAFWRWGKLPAELPNIVRQIEEAMRNVVFCAALKTLKPDTAQPQIRWIDRSELVFRRRLGEGGYGGVDEYEWKGRSKPVAVKTLSWEGREILEHESALLSKVQGHPNVVEFYGCAFNEKQNKGMLVMELLKKDLRSLIDECRRGQPPGAAPFSQRVAVDMMRQMAAGLQHLRQLRVLHRDLKSLNILVNPRRSGNELYYDVKLSDFGRSN